MPMTSKLTSPKYTTHSLIHTLTHSLTHSLMHLLMLSLTHTNTPPLTPPPPHSKTFVDMPMRQDPEIILAAWDEGMCVVLCCTCVVYFRVSMLYVYWSLIHTWVLIDTH